MRKSADEILTVSPEIEKVVNDGQRLITYIARDGDSQLDPEITRVIIEAKHKVSNGKWCIEDENIFLLNYDKLAKIVYPVTIESIHAIIPLKHNQNRVMTKAERAVAWYRRYTMFALLLLLISQIYWLFGNDLRGNLKEHLVDKESFIKVQSDGGITDGGFNSDKLKYLDQQIDANYQLLSSWNKVWSFGGHFQGSLPKHYQDYYEFRRAIFERDKVDDLDGLVALDLEKSKHELELFRLENLLSAEFVLKAFQGYILPLLYGLLGAFIFVLRSLLREIKSLTYTFDSEIRFRLRLTLGALGGMIIGWFLKPDDTNAIASLSPMALAFLMGYNVDVLFSIMDRMIDNIKNAVEKPDAGKAINKDVKS